MKVTKRTRNLLIIKLVFFLSVSCVLSAAKAQQSAQEQEAAKIFDATGVKGGLVVHVGCGDGKLTTALRATESFLVHGLDTNPQKIEQAHDYIRSRGLYGKVSVNLFDGKYLPYVENLVNLLVCQDLGTISKAELMRVLCPNGIAYVKENGSWIKLVKARPDDIDEWTHYLHDASNNAVVHDMVVGPPRHMQWVGKPKWTRHHDHMSSLNAMVSANGRIFYIIDEGPTADIQLPSEWSLIARDAFNGVVLWKRRIDHWHTQLWPNKGGPAQLPRRLVAIGDMVYVTLGLNAPLTALDAATGKTVRTYEQTKAAEEVIHSSGVLFTLVNEKAPSRPWSTRRCYASYSELQPEPETWTWDAGPRSILAVDAITGEVLWKVKSPVVPLTLAADDTRVFFHDGTKIVSLYRTNGRQSWASKSIARAQNIRSWFAPTLVAYKDVVLFAGGEKIRRHRGGTDTITALSTATGRILWTAQHPPSGYDSPEDLWVINDLVWSAPTTNKWDTGEFTGRDLRTGEVKRSFPADDGVHMPHHRCHRAKATDRYILTSRTGIEYIDLRAQHWNRHDWVRGACLYGIVPANGLTYAPPHPCACYVVAKLNGLNALAPESPTRRAQRDVPDAGRLELGPAYLEVKYQKSKGNAPDDWPTYRHDAARSGGTLASVPVYLNQTWQTTLSGTLTSPVVAEGKVFVASIDAHTVHALDELTGKVSWNFTAGARVDSPPTIWHGRVLFGSADGYVYCLRADDGVLAWRFRAAPVDERLMSFEQIESVWPVHGSVLVLRPLSGSGSATVHCVAGRSMFLDGGMRYLRLEAETGKKISETILDNLHPQTGKPLDANVKWPNLPVALPDILSYDGQYIYMRSQRFDLTGRRIEVVAPSDFKDQTGDGTHLFCPTGFLDDSWWHRTYWMYGKSPIGGASGWYRAAYVAPAGRIMVCDDSHVYAFGRQPQYFTTTTAMAYHLFAASKEPEIISRNPRQTAKVERTAKGRPAPTQPKYNWSHEVPLLGRAIVLADKTLFVAGPPDLVDQKAALAHFGDPETTKKLAEQSEAYRGKQGALLWVVSAIDGRKLAQYRFRSVPVFDGMAASGRRLYISTIDAKVLCLAGGK